jgi:hypothetical protein
MGALIKDGQIAFNGSINIQEVPSGFYFIQLIDTDQKHSMKRLKN